LGAIAVCGIKEVWALDFLFKNEASGKFPIYKERIFLPDTKNKESLDDDRYMM
jgi:hypothetical protein